VVLTFKTAYAGDLFFATFVALGFPIILMVVNYSWSYLWDRLAKI
jgi:uncharacterized membrane protein